MRDFKPIDGGDSYYCYTCQSIDDNKLKYNGIKKIGEKFGIEAREVLAIPKRLFAKFGYFTRSIEEVQINAENILKLLHLKK